MSAPSLRRDLTWRLLLGLLAAWLLALAGAGLALKTRTDRIFDSALQETAERILPLAIMETEADRYRRDQKDRRGHRDDDEDHDDDDRPREIRRLPQPAAHDEYLTYLLRDHGGRVLVYSHDADLDAFDAAAPQGISTVSGHRLYTRSTDNKRYTIQVVEPLAVRREALLSTLALMLLPLALVLPLSILAIRRTLRRGLRPVEALAAELGQRGAQDLSPLPAVGLKAELAPIRDAVNRLMERVLLAFEAERSFSSNAAHELRTPIAATLAHTQRLIHEAPPGPLRDRALQVEAELKRMTRLAEKLLQLARAEGGGVIATAPHDLVPILAALSDDLGRDLPPGRILLTSPETAVMSRLDPDAFAVLARNLIENALFHGAADTPVHVELSAKGFLSVSNDGPVVPPALLAQLTTRFERAGSRAPGSGLGLTIAAGIAAATGSALRLSSPRPGFATGFVASVNVATPAPDRDKPDPEGAGIG